MHLAAAIEDTRRRAGAALGKPLLEVPIERLSRVHVAIEGFVKARSAEGWTKQDEKARIVLDTGASTVFGTANAGARFPLRTAPQTLRARSFHGESSALYPIDPRETLALSLVPRRASNAVETLVPYLAPATLYGADFIAPPRMLAPVGGAVRLDLRRNVFAVCETLRDCEHGAPFSELAVESCPDVPELLGVRISLEGHAARLLLDTGAPTLIFKEFYEREHLLYREQSRQAGNLTGMAGSAPDAALALGSWAFHFEGSPAIDRTTNRLWVVIPSPQGVSHCFPDGSAGLDLIEGCELLLIEGKPRVLLRCEP
jgi:hypothetical protein